MMNAKNVDLKGRVAIVTGGSRGIGRQCCIDLAKKGVNIVIAAKSADPQPTLPNTIYSVAREVEALGVKALPFQVDVRDAKSIEECVKKTIEMFGRIDILINNASALWWESIVDTPPNKYDLINQVNARGTFLMTRACLPHMEKNRFGHIIIMSPPINLSPAAIRNRTAYSISKYGMTLVALGVAAEYAGSGICANTLWPATVIESSAAENFQLGDPSMWRKSTILSDCVLSFLQEDPFTFTGNQLVDEDYLISRGVHDFKKYRMVQDVEPPKMYELGVSTFKRSKALKPEERAKVLEEIKSSKL